MAASVQSIRPNMTIGDWAKLLLLSLLFGGAFFFVGIAVTELSPLMIAALRVGLASIVLLSVAFAQGARIPVDGNSWRTFFGMGLLNNVIPFLLIAWGQTQISSGLAAILNATAPLFTVVIASLLLADEKATPTKLVGVAVGFCGVVVLFGLPVLGGGGARLAQAAVLAAALSYAFAGVYGRRFRKMGLNPTVAAGGQLFASTVILVPVTLVVGGWTEVSNVSTQTWMAIAGLALVSTAAANVLYFRLLASVGATNLLLVALLIPVSALMLGWLFLNEIVEPVHLIGMSIIALGLSIIDGRVLRLRNSAKPLFFRSRGRISR